MLIKIEAKLQCTKNDEGLILLLACTRVVNVLSFLNGEVENKVMLKSHALFEI